MLSVVQSCIGTKYTSRFGSMMVVSFGKGRVAAVVGAAMSGSWIYQQIQKRH